MFDSDSTIMLGTLNRVLGAVEPGERTAAEIDRAFRAAHSIKSEAGFLGVTAVAESAHLLEDTLTGVRKGGGAIDESTAAALRLGVRELAGALQRYRASRERGAGSPEADAATEAAGCGGNADERTEGAQARHTSRHLAAQQGILREARLRGERLYRVVVGIDTVPQMRYARAFLVINNLEISCAVVSVEPPAEDMHRAAARQLTIIVTSGGDEESVRRAVHVDEVELMEITELSFAEVFDESDEPYPGALAVSERAPVQAPPVWENQEEMLLLADEVAAAVSIVGDGARASGDLAPALRRAAHYAGILQDRVNVHARVQLLDLLREVRLSSIRYAAGQGKRVRVAVGGQGALVSAAVGDALLEAVMHLVRNSIDHGIETIEARATAGRHPAATIRIRVDRLGERVRMIVQDDGKGVHEAAVRERSGEQESALLDILARPGFSMRDAPDRSSGRGVGLDNVVHTVRTLLRGELRMINKPDAGVSFVVTVPAATRLVHVVVAESEGSAYAIPRATVIGQERIERSRVRRDSLGGLYYTHDGRMLQLSTMSGRAASLRSVRDGSVGLVVRAGTDRRVLLADAVLGEEAVVREQTGSRHVHSRTTGSDAVFVFPASIAVEERLAAATGARA